MNKLDRKSRVIARGEHSNHSHVLIGDAIVERNDKGEIIMKVGSEGAVMRHILESNWIESGQQVWTEEHQDVKLPKGEYIYIPQIEKDPFTNIIREVLD